MSRQFLDKLLPLSPSPNNSLTDFSFTNVMSCVGPTGLDLLLYFRWEGSNLYERTNVSIIYIVACKNSS